MRIFRLEQKFKITSMMLRVLFVSAILSCSLSVFSYAADNPIDETNNQIVFVDQMMHDIEQQKLQREAEAQAEENRRLARKKKKEEARIAKQFAGLSGKLSHMPEMPNFQGNLKTEEKTEELTSAE